MGVLVLGMHRSGTSAVTLSLHRLGLAVPEGADLQVGHRDNPEGHWESRSLIAFNDALLSGLGGAWFVPPTLERGWAEHPRLEPDVAQAAELFPRVFHGDRWVWKDPRNCILAPFWYRVLGDEHAVVVVFRNPLEVAASLQKRNGMAKPRALALWAHYTWGSLLNAGGHPTLVTSYDRALEATADWLEEARRFLAAHGLEPGEADEDAVRQQVRPDLRHAVSDDAAVDSDPDLTASQRHLFTLLGQLEGAHDRLTVPGLAP